jgi:hypothetical protein
MNPHERNLEGKNPMQPEPKPQQISESSQAANTEEGMSHARFAELQSAMRFPLKLPVSLKTQGQETPAETQNISANGVLFQVEAEMPVGSRVEFSISVPGDVVGTDHEVRLDCRGRVVRSYAEGSRRGVGVVIDEYHLEHN